ncbi:hypothetical protein [Salmonella phage SSBI34]|nr:hypothetical protein [Salmonella phage SSBI34]
MIDGLSMEDILQELDMTYPGFDDDDVIDYPIGRLKGILHEAISTQQSLRGVREVGLAKFKIGDLVKDNFSGKTFKVTHAEITEGDKGYEWFYRKGIYYIPESDLELIKGE